MFALLVLVALVAVVLWLEFERQKVSRRLRGVPGPKEYPFIGNLLMFEQPVVEEKGEKKHLVERAMELYDFPLVKLFVGPGLALLVSDPDVMQKILSSNACLDRPYVLEFLRGGSSALLAGRYSVWKNLRKPLSPAFKLKILHSFIPTFVDYSERLNKILDRHVGGPAFDLCEIVKDTFLKVIFETSTQTEFNESMFTEADFQALLEIEINRMVNVVHHPDLIWKWTDHYRKEEGYIKKFYDVFIKIVADRKQTLKSNNEAADIKNESDSEKPKIFLDQLYYIRNSEGKPLSDLEIHQNLVTIIFAGYETLAITCSFVVLMLAMHPEIDERVYMEISENYSEGDAIEPEMLKRFDYLDLVIKETLRLFPAVPIVARSTTEEADIGICKVPKWTSLGLNILRMHRDPNLWGPDALKFNPDNFLPENVAQRHPYCYVPFSGGQRNCIGNRYALLAMKVCLVHLLHKYKFSTRLKMDELKFRITMTLVLRNGHMVQVERRQTTSAA